LCHAAAVASGARKRRDYAARGDLANRAVVYVGDIHVTRAIHRHAVGGLNRATLPVPFALPLIPAEPARVLTTPLALILRIVWLYWLALHFLSKATFAASQTLDARFRNTKKEVIFPGLGFEGTEAFVVLGSS
jgi:hypothetical protein